SGADFRVGFLPCAARRAPSRLTHTDFGRRRARMRAPACGDRSTSPVSSRTLAAPEYALPVGCHRTAMHLPRNLALLAFAVTFIALACAQSVDNPSDDPGGSPPGPGSGGAAGGAGGVGGAGGSGGGLCAVDCST